MCVFMCGYAGICVGMQVYVWVCRYMCGYVGICVGMQVYVWVCRWVGICCIMIITLPYTPLTHTLFTLHPLFLAPPPIPVPLSMSPLPSLSNPFPPRFHPSRRFHCSSTLHPGIPVSQCSQATWARQTHHTGAAIQRPTGREPRGRLSLGP